MEDFKSKFFEGANTVKEKFETSQELSETRAELKKLEDERTNFILELGESAYANFRRKLEEDLPYTDQIIEIDKRIHELLKVIEEKKKEAEERTCECGNPLSPSDKFCKKCGKKVEEEKEVDQEDMLACPTCHTLNEEDNNFCISCGNKLV